jgi:hypothetical protein
MFRNRRLLDLAHRITECTINIPGCHGHAPNGCEPAHSNWHEHGKGKSLKAHDCFFAAACHSCHVELDQGSRYAREEKKEFWQRGHARTLLILWERGWIKVT